MKIIKALSLIMALCVLAAVLPFGASAAAQPALRVSDAVCSPGAEVKVTVAIENNPGLVSMSLMCTYDATLLTLVDVEDAGILGDEMHKPEYTQPYYLTWANDTSKVNFTDNGTLVTLTFKVSEQAKGGSSSAIEISYNKDNFDIYDKDAEPIDLAVYNGSVTVSAQVNVPLSDIIYGKRGTSLIIRGYSGDDTELVFEPTYTVNGVVCNLTSVDQFAFESNTTITSIVFPETLTLIDEGAFWGCSSLKTVTFLSGDVDISEYAFDSADGITIIGIAGSSVEEYAKTNGFGFVPLGDEAVKGDIDLDGDLDADDLALLRKTLIKKLTLSGDALTAADAHNDGIIDIRDLVNLKKAFVRIM